MGWLVGEEIEYRLRVGFEEVLQGEPPDNEARDQHERFIDTLEAIIKAALDGTELKDRYDLRVECSHITAWHSVP